MILLIQNNSLYEADLRAMLQAFFPATRIATATPEEAGTLSTKMFREMDFCLTALFAEKRTRLMVEEKGRIMFSGYCTGDFENRKRFRNKLKLLSYKLLSEYAGRDLPWGSLTGMRPTKIAAEAFHAGLSTDEVVDYYERTYQTSREKAALAAEVALHEKPILSGVNPVRDYCLYVHIPFCPTRCLYCSFAAYSVMDVQTKISAYLGALKEELQYISLLNMGRTLKSIYIGGGTPTALSAEQLETLLSSIEETFDMETVTEYTVEAGRPDSITKEKLRCMKAHGVTRISINPQTMNEETLRIIGRSHTPADIQRAFLEARKAGFDDINMDIIAGLPGENLDSMRYTLNELEKLGPDSLTVHSLAIKRTANLNMQLDDYKDDLKHDVAGMVRMADMRARKWGLEPYYLYRQRNIAGNLENTGYVRPGLDCKYNVLIMEERIDTFAAGAGAISRLVTYDQEKDETVKCTRVENVKNMDVYIERIDEMKERLRDAVDTRDREMLLLNQKK